MLDLLQILSWKCDGAHGMFDEKLADYVFFPLSHIIKHLRNPDRLAELATKCLRVLLSEGWRINMRIDLAHQLLLLLTFYAGGAPPNIIAPEELRREAYSALAILFRNLHNTPNGSASLVEVSKIPALGHCITVILDGITDGPSAEIQLEALGALDSIWSCLKDQQARTNFLPGTASGLTRSLTPSTQNPRKRKVLVKGLEVLKNILILSLGDVQLRGRITNEDVHLGSTPSLPWMKATASQIKLALANVTKLRRHEHDGVKQALLALCIAVLDECHASLADCAGLLTETALILSNVEENFQGLSRKTSLRDLVIVYPSIAELVRETIYNWSTSFPRVMLSNDEGSKHFALQQLSTAYRIFVKFDKGSRTLNDAIINALRYGVVSLAELLNPSKGIEESSLQSVHRASTILANHVTGRKRFEHILMPHESQTQTRDELQALISSFGSAEVLTQLAAEMMSYIDDSSGTNLLSVFWLAFQLLKAAQVSSMEVDVFFDIATMVPNDMELVREDLYSYSLSILTENDEEVTDWRLQAVALEVLAFTAQTAGKSFRTNLIDALFPVLQSLGSPHPNIRAHAIISLDMISTSCEYLDTTRMIIENIDYLINAISLKLNTFDISPQAPQVLIMMIKLSGPGLLPYLDDVIESIFAALNNFHGYSRLVESLFAVLGEIVQQGSKSNPLLPTACPNSTRDRMTLTGPSMGEIASLLEKRHARISDCVDILSDEFPRGPWNSAKSLLDTTDSNQAEEDSEILSQRTDEVQKVAPTKVYIKVQSIVRLGQHYLTNQSPLLRRYLLDLISTACNALYANEDEFLPLVNDIWPVLIKRLYDEEPFVIIAASRTVAEICKHAGDFISTRIQSEWRDLTKLFERYKSKADAEMRGHHARGIFAHNWQVWEALITLLVSILQYTRIDDDMFDEINELLMDNSTERNDVREALLAVNADAVWLYEYVRGGGTTKEPPVCEGYRFSSIPLL